MNSDWIKEWKEEKNDFIHHHNIKHQDFDKLLIYKSIRVE